MLRSALFAGAAIALLPKPAFAQTEPATAPTPAPAPAADDGVAGAAAPAETTPAETAPADAPPPQGDDRRAAAGNDIVVTGSRIRGPDLLSGTTAVSGE